MGTDARQIYRPCAPPRTNSGPSLNQIPNLKPQITPISQIRLEEKRDSNSPSTFLFLMSSRRNQCQTLWLK
jgi:hypothetical protein